MISRVLGTSSSGMRGGQVTLAFIVVGILVAYSLSDYILADDVNSLVLIALAVVACAIVVVILNNWRNGLLLLLIWMLFEDFARKYLGNNMAIYFGKDILALIVYLSFFIAIRKEKLPIFRPPFRMPLLLIVWFGFMQIFNPGSPSIFFGLMGFKLFFYYVPLMIIGYAYLSSEKNLRRFFFLNLILLLIIGSLGGAQSVLGHTFLNPQNLQEDIRDLAMNYRTSPITGLTSYRPTSVFVSAGRYADYLGVAWVSALGFTGFLLFRQKQGRTLGFVAVAVTAGALLLTASRGAFSWGIINAAVFSIAFLWGAPWHNGEVIRVLRTIQRTTFGILVAFFFLALLFPEALQSRLSLYYETMSPGSSHSELAFRTWAYPLENFLGAFDFDRWPYGYGIGTCGLGVQYVSRFFHVVPPNAGVESGFGEIVLQLGIVGLVLWLVLTGAILLSVWRVVIDLRGTMWFPLGFAIFWFAFMVFVPYMWGGMVAYEDFIINAYLWVLLGMLFRLPEFAHAEKLVLASANSTGTP
ncbi:MAG: hypothetical protein C5B47_04585 [Verrucomicrobia bacterium]|nr:MAG: hypothetical protein C5B47_04585 [Verrucomicrobiota bacterium]